MPEGRDGRRRVENPAEALRRLDAQERGRLRHEPQEETRSPWRRLGRQIFWLAVAMVAIGVLGFGGGWLYATLWGPSAARAVLSERVDVEPDVREGAEPADGSDAAPTSGDPDGAPVCGVRTDPVPAGRQVATLEAGGVVVQYRPGDVDARGRDVLGAIAREHPSHVLVAPNPSLHSPVEATAWQRRLRLEEVERATLRAFVEGHRHPRGEPADCPT